MLPPKTCRRGMAVPEERMLLRFQAKLVANDAFWSQQKIKTDAKNPGGTRCCHQKVANAAGAAEAAGTFKTRLQPKQAVPKRCPRTNKNEKRCS